MSGRVEGKRVLITGAARGMGRSHAVRLAQEGADLILVDICESMPGIEYPLATTEDLAETARLVGEHGRRAVTHIVDVRDLDALTAAVDDGVAPALPGRPGSEFTQVGLLIGQHPLGLMLGHREQQLLLAAGEVVKQLTLGGLGARPDVIEGGRRYPAGANLGGGALDDPPPGGRPLAGQFLDLRVHFDR